MKSRPPRRDRPVAADRPPASPPPATDRAELRAMLEWLALGYFAVLVGGFVLLRLRGTMARGNELNVDRAVFTAVDAATLTGFQLNTGAAQFDPASPLGPLALFLLTLGGAFFTLVIGGLLAARILRLGYSNRRVMAAAALATGAATVGGTVPLLVGGHGVVPSLLLAAAAFANSGVHLGPVPGVGAGVTHLVLLPLGMAGGIGLTVLMELYDRVRSRRPLSAHARTVLVLAAVVYVCGTALLLAVRAPFWATLTTGFSEGGWTWEQGNALRLALASSSAEAVNGRSVGLPLEFVNVLPRPSQWVLLALMAVGASPAGTGGGLKPTTLLHLARGVRNALAGRPIARTAGVAAVWAAGFGGVAVLGFAALLLQVPQMPADQLLFLSVSAAGNVGLSHDALSLVTGPLLTLSAVMAAGRAGPLLVLWWMAETTPDADVLVA